MTRFARAKGSKASNERAPDDSTPWEVMKEHLLQAKKETEESKKRHEAETQRLENYQNFLNERKVQKKKAVWCDFPEAERAQQDQPKKKKKKIISENASETQQSISTDEISSDAPKKKNKNKKKNKSNSTVESDSLTGNENEHSTEKPCASKKKKMQNAPVPLDGGSGPTEALPSENNKKLVPKAKNLKKDKKNKKFVDGKSVRRKEITERSFQLIINGKDVELVRFDGFPIMKKDAERLQELKNSMIKKGIPKSEVQRTMKLERRRAEKALARLKRDVCYNCRKGGHNLSDCPDLKSKIPGLDAAEGVCFKCGSTEHKQFECKVQKNMDFKFATCFICKEPGHIARQCPDNPKGLYPNGGCCKLCGDVTHLRKDCPTVQDKREESSIKLQTLNSDDNIESIGVQNTAAVSEKTKPPKKIKF